MLWMSTDATSSLSTVPPGTAGPHIPESPRALIMTCHRHWSHHSYSSGRHPSILETLQVSSAPLKLDFWLRFSFWPWIRKSFFLRSFCRLSFSSSSFCFIFTCSLLCRCLCSLAFFIFWLCIVLRASSRARTWQDKIGEHKSVWACLSPSQDFTTRAWSYQIDSISSGNSFSENSSQFACRYICIYLYEKSTYICPVWNHVQLAKWPTRQGLLLPIQI